MSDHSLAQERLRARARRITLVRKRVVAVSLATFVLAFGVIAYDGSMGATTAATGQPSTTTTTPQSSSTTSSSSAQSSSGTSPMTTQQS